MREINLIVVHCSATRPEWMEGEGLASQIREIARWHVQRGFRREGYHWFIGRDGRVLPGRPESEEGAHVVGSNEDSIGVCLIGGHGSDATDDFADHFTPQQDAALRRLLGEIQSRHGACIIIGHNKLAGKACPGFQVEDWLVPGASDPLGETPPAPWWAHLWAAIRRIMG
jgi:N-acetyl-anhydromuramyl-L-alanine amidase AmpD